MVSAADPYGRNLDFLDRLVASRIEIIFLYCNTRQKDVWTFG
jgi:hypothetical protein